MRSSRLYTIVVGGALLVATLALPGCNPARNLSPTDSLEEFDGKRFIRAAKSRDVAFQTLAIRGKGRSAGLTNLSFSYRLNIEQGKQIWASLRVFGLEGFRARITPKSIEILDRLKTKVIAGSPEDLKKRLGFSVKYDMLEELLLGQASMVKLAKPTSVSAGTKHYQTTWKGTRYTFDFNSQTGKLKQLKVVQDVENSETLIEYDQHELTDGQYVPYFVGVESDGSDQPLELTLRHKSVEINPQRIRFNFNVPDSYDREDL